MVLLKFKKIIRVLDYSIAVGCLAWGFWRMSPWWIAGGVLGLVLAWWNPSARFEAYLRQRIRPAVPPPSTPDSLKAKK